MPYRTPKKLSALHGLTRTFLKSIMLTIVAMGALATISPAAELPVAPGSIVRLDAAVTAARASASMPRIAETNTLDRKLDKKFVGLAFISTTSTFADSYTTLFARENWLAGKKGVCNEEVDSAYLYGTHPTVARAYAVASAKSAGAILMAYYLRRHHSRFWSAPLVTNSIVSLGGVTQNMIMCN
jgi:hypothetical protein